MEDSKIQNLEKEVVAIKLRNSSVEADKAWETSWTRRILIAIFTYLAISFYLYAIEVDRPFLNGIVPAIAFMLSTLTLPWVKSIWIKNKFK